MNKLPDALAPCGVFCGACPSFNKSCLGCSATSRDQKRTSKWGCKIRKCCYEQHSISSCAFCSEFPCEKVNQKLINSHPNDPRFVYRHEIIENHQKFLELGLEAYADYQDQRWTCKNCGGRVVFYDYECQDCGTQMRP